MLDVKIQNLERIKTSLEREIQDVKVDQNQFARSNADLRQQMADLRNKNMQLESELVARKTNGSPAFKNITGNGSTSFSALSQENARLRTQLYDLSQQSKPAIVSDKENRVLKDRLVEQKRLNQQLSDTNAQMNSDLKMQGEYKQEVLKQRRLLTEQRKINEDLLYTIRELQQQATRPSNGPLGPELYGKMELIEGENRMYKEEIQKVRQMLFDLTVQSEKQDIAIAAEIKKRDDMIERLKMDMKSRASFAEPSTDDVATKQVLDELAATKQALARSESDRDAAAFESKKLRETIDQLQTKVGQLQGKLATAGTSVSAPAPVQTPPPNKASDGGDDDGKKITKLQSEVTELREMNLELALGLESMLHQRVGEIEASGTLTPEERKQKIAEAEDAEKKFQQIEDRTKALTADAEGLQTAETGASTVLAPLVATERLSKQVQEKDEKLQAISAELDEIKKMNLDLALALEEMLNQRYTDIMKDTALTADEKAKQLAAVTAEEKSVQDLEQKTRAIDGSGADAGGGGEKLPSETEEKLRKEITELRQQNIALAEGLENILAQKYDDLQNTDLADTQSNLADTQKQLELLRNEMTEMRKMNRDLAEGLEEAMNQKYTDLQSTDLSDAQKTIELLRTEMTELRKMNLDLAEGLEEAMKQRYSDLQNTDLPDAQKTIESLRKEMTEMRKMNLDLAEGLEEALNQKFADLQNTDLPEATKKLEAALLENDSLKAQMTELKGQNLQLALGLEEMLKQRVLDISKDGSLTPEEKKREIAALEITEKDIEKVEQKTRTFQVKTFDKAGTNGK